MLRNLCTFTFSTNIGKCIYQTHSVRGMAGHSKWANIKHTKALKDGARAALFAKISRQIRMAIQEGNSADPAINSLLRTEIERALKQNMPSGTIQNTLNKFKSSKVQLKKYRLDIRYKRSVYLICIFYTDNFSGVKMDATPMIKKAGGEFMDVGNLFEDFGLIEARYDASKLLSGSNLEDKATNDAIELGAEEIEIVDNAEGSVNFLCSPVVLTSLSRNLEKAGYTVESSEHIFSPMNAVKLSPEDQKAYDVFIEKLRNIPGLEDIYDNVE
ncbi:probable transcriptional regulatory protein MCA1220 [Drosophila subpulchrella]|uniref:probable transcriptional regulatory protein MCA1220 n=1 Tax=Drosophila subpulchrella TaxID=1486046 RepID=UPI0018A181F6|nr:probable transcriptional regulatory protein MCA1220 [Drosophila subpulchrella]